MHNVTIEYEGCIITTDKALMRIHDVHQWLSEVSYWANGIPFDTFKTAFENSYCIGAVIAGKQVAFGRLVTDYATFGYLADVYVEEAHRGKGISKKMMELLLNQDWVKGLRAIRLATMDAHGLYKQYGFTESRHPERMMEITRQDIYTTPKEERLTV